MRGASLRRKTFPRRGINTEISPLRSHGFPVEVGGAGEQHAPFLKERRTRGLSRVARQEIRVRSGPTARRGRRDDKERATVEWRVVHGRPGQVAGARSFSSPTVGRRPMTTQDDGFVEGLKTCGRGV